VSHLREIGGIIVKSDMPGLLSKCKLSKSRSSKNGILGSK